MLCVAFYLTKVITFVKRHTYGGRCIQPFIRLIENHTLPSSLVNIVFFLYFSGHHRFSSAFVLLIFLTFFSPNMYFLLSFNSFPYLVHFPFVLIVSGLSVGIVSQKCAQQHCSIAIIRNEQNGEAQKQQIEWAKAPVFSLPLNDSIVCAAWRMFICI